MANSAAASAAATVEANVEIHMVRPGLDGLPNFVLPAGFSLRRGPNAADWVAIQSAAEPFLAISLRGQQEGAWQREFEPGGGNLPADASRDEALRNQFFLIEDATGAAVGTATAWRSRHHAEYAAMLQTYKGPDAVDVRTDGLVHWVAIRPEYQGRGLSKVLLSAVLNRFAGMGCRTCTLGTSSGRAQAIPLYLGLGFEPMIFSDCEREAWRGLCARAAATLKGGGIDARTERSQTLLAERLKAI